MTIDQQIKTTIKKIITNNTKEKCKQNRTNFTFNKRR